MKRTLEKTATCMAVQDRDRLPEFSAAQLPPLRSLANFLELNHLAVDPQTVGKLGKILGQFDAVDARAALTTAIRNTGVLHTDRVLWILADRTWPKLGLPPTVDEFIRNVWDTVWKRGRPWTATEQVVVERYGWQNITGQEYEKASIITAQLRVLYEAERARVVDEWIAKTCLEAE